MKKVFIAALLVTLMSNAILAQQATNCSDAVTQLQQYASRVNNFYSAEYWSVIPNQRCPAFNAWGQPFNPVVVQNCRLTILAYLNNWYAQQCTYVNTLYAQIVRGCSTNPPRNVIKPAPGGKSGSEESDEINTDKIEDLTAGIDEEKAIKITIPKNPTGYRPKQ